MTMKMPGQLILGGIAARASRISALERIQIAMIAILVQNAVRMANKRLPTSTVKINGHPYCLHVYGL